MNYDVQYLTFTVFDNDEEVVSRLYPVRAMLVPQNIVQQKQPKHQEKPKEYNKEEKNKLAKKS